MATPISSSNGGVISIQRVWSGAASRIAGESAFHALLVGHRMRRRRAGRRAGDMHAAGRDWHDSRCWFPRCWCCCFQSLTRS